MTFNEIKDLRKSGKLEEALIASNQALEANPDNIWNKRAAVWVYYDYLKKYSDPSSFDKFMYYLRRVESLNLQEDEFVVYDQVSWKVGSMVFALAREETLDDERINELFSVVSKFEIIGPSDGYSFLFKAFHKCFKDSESYIKFADWWGFFNFRQEDYEKEEFGGKRNISVVERAYIAYSKQLLAGTSQDAFGMIRTPDQEKIKVFMPLLDRVIDEHTEYQYPLYYKVKLMMIDGNTKDVLSTFIPFAKRKQSDFWVWDLMADIFPEEEGLQFACYCKALSLNAPKEFVGKIRIKLAQLLIKDSRFLEAKTEIKAFISTYSAQKWKIPAQVITWTTSPWYETTEDRSNNRKLYAEYADKADEILYLNVPEEIVLVEFVNRNKHMINFVHDESRHGFFKYSGQLKDPQIGDLLKVRLRGNEQTGFQKLLTVKLVDQNTKIPAIKEFTGNIKVISPANFGFVDDVFLQPDMVRLEDLSDGQLVSGIAVLSYNKKKENWGWKAIEVG
jgi:hypothetical protein